MTKQKFSSLNNLQKNPSSERNLSKNTKITKQSKSKNKNGKNEIIDDLFRKKMKKIYKEKKAEV